MLPSEYRIATPVSHHFTAEHTAQQLSALSDALELRHNGIEPPTTTELIYHAEANAAIEWSDSDVDQLHEMSRSYDPELVSLHLATRYQETEVANGKFIGQGTPYSREQLIANVERNITTVRDLFGETTILLENNNHLGTDAYDVVTDPSFINTVVRRTDTGLLLDIAHAKITAHNTDRTVARYIERLPLDRCKQIHLSRHEVGPAGAIDAHTYLHEEDWEYFESIQAETPDLTYVTLEYYEDATVLTDQLERLQSGESSTVVREEQWDSEFFGYEIASVHSEETTPECLDYALTRCREMDIDCLYFDTVDLRDEALERGFDLVDEKIVFRRSIDNEENLETDGAVRPCAESDLPELTEIAGEIFSETRFYNDPRFETEKCDALYERWITNACASYADAVLVATVAEKPCGFITCNVEGTRGDIGLVGVEQSVQGDGIGTKLVTAAIEWFRKQDVTSVTVETQSKNTAARRLYTTAGFRESEQRSVFHRWFDHS
jgi:uncharacterized protein (UPF0276 family)/ribosomal protein S18 acetylase RimI-like enzyme